MALAILDDRDSVRHGSVPGEWSMDKPVRIYAARYGRHDFVRAALLVPHSDLPPGPSAVRHDDLHCAPDMDRTASGDR